MGRRGEVNERINTEEKERKKRRKEAIKILSWSPSLKVRALPVR
jgi:hypothetical protein